MHNLRKFFYQNKYQILKVIGIVAFIIIIIQLMNMWTKKSNNLILTNNTTTSSNNSSNNSIISDKSAVTGKQISEKELNNATETINKFMNYCNNQDFENAYKIITDECKNQMFTTVDGFKKSYYKSVFYGEKRNWTIENWVKDTYRVKITGDILATGKDDGYSKQDYITVVNVGDEYKLNINNYIGYSQINKKTTKDNITIEVIGKNTYKEYEEYTIKATNKTENIMQLSSITDTNTVYIEDSKGVKYYYYNHELTTPMVTIYSGQTAEVTIKFYSSYVSTKEIKHIVFSNLILKNGQNGEVIKFEADV